jgi:hypothetical protein
MKTGGLLANSKGNKTARDQASKALEGLLTEEWYGNFRGQRCIRTSYNGNIRGKYAGIGDTYDEATDTFVSPITGEQLIEEETDGNI